MKEISRLRLKFMCCNMLIVTAVMGLTFCAVSLIMEKRVSGQGQAAISQALTQAGGRQEQLGDAVRNEVMRYGVLACGAIWLGFLALSYIFARWAVKPVEESIRMQKQFVADASHELKTPLTVITANTELLQERYAGISSEADKWLEHISQECKEMRSLVESLLLLAKNDACTPKRGSFHLFSLSDLVTENVLIFEPVFYQKEKRLEYQIDDGIRMLGDQEQLGRLIRALLDNAVKYSLPGGRTEVKLEPAGRKRAKLWVNSQGKPIPEEKRSLIFRRFCRGDSAGSSCSGCGLGLSIAAETAEKHKGRIGLEYRDGMNCFYVTVKRGGSF